MCWLISAHTSSCQPATLSLARASLAGITNVEVAEMDLIDPASVRIFAERFGSHRRTTAFADPQRRHHDAASLPRLKGREGQFATNHLGHFRLTCHAVASAEIGRWSASGRSVLARSPLAGIRPDRSRFCAPALRTRWPPTRNRESRQRAFCLGSGYTGANYGIRAFSVQPSSVFGNLTKHASREELEAYGILNPTALRRGSAQDKKNFACAQQLTGLAWRPHRDWTD